MDDSLKHKIFIETDCLSEQTMFDYIDKKLSARESHSVEKHLLHCELCSDALEGLELTSNRERIATINHKVREYIAPKKETSIISFNYKLIISIAASVLLLIGGVFFFNQFSQKDEIAEFKSENAVLPPPPPPPSFLEDESTLDSINVRPINIAKEEKEIETKKDESTIEPDTKFRLDKMKKTDQPATSEGQGSIAVSDSPSQPDSKTRISTGEKVADNAGASYYPITQTLENKKGTANAPMKSDNISPKSELHQYAKDANLFDLKNADALGGIANEESLELSESTLTISKSAAPSGSGDSYDYGDDKATKKLSKANNLFRSESKVKRKTEKDNEDRAAQDIAYAPQSIVADDEKLVPAKVAESEPDQLQDEIKSIDQMPEFPGGQDSLLKFIHENFKYPSGYRTESSSTKKLYVTFIVDEVGRIKHSKILKGINSELDKEALRVVNSMPRWKPGINNGKNVSFSFNLPIKLD